MSQVRSPAVLTKTFIDEAGDYNVPNVLSPRNIVIRGELLKASLA